MAGQFTFGLSEYFGTHSVVAAVAGGAVLGTAVIFRLCVLGQILGISGITRSCIMKPDLTVPLQRGKVCFLIGLAAGGALMAAVYGGMEPVPPPYALEQPSEHAWLRLRLSVGGFIVGVGTSFSNGCTSGHGLTGLARLSPRSWVAVITFMGCALATGTLLHSGRALPANAHTEATAPSMQTAVYLSLAICAALLLLIGSAVPAERALGSEAAQKYLQPVYELVGGFAFAAGLVISGMARPSKVAGFLDIGSGTWDPSLPFVMCGALLLTFPFYQVLERRKSASSLLGCSWDMPPTTIAIDKSLVLGAVAFGMGWGICGCCPGPAWVLAGGRPCLDVAILLVSIILGLSTWVVWQKFVAQPAASSKAALSEESAPLQAR